MGKLLRPQDILLLFLAGGLDIFTEFKNEPMATACKNLYGWVPSRYRKSNLLQTFYHSLRTGYIEKVIKDGEVHLRLTPKGNDKRKRDFPLSNWQRRRWDGKWRVVIFDIEEVSRGVRDRLRTKLRELGFGMFQQSVWINPYDFVTDFREFIESWGLQNTVFILETSSILAGDNKLLTAQVWPVDFLNQRYEELLDELIKLNGRGEVSTEELAEIRSQYLEILREDPCLPEELLPTNWFRQKVEKVLKKLK